MILARLPLALPLMFLLGCDLASVQSPFGTQYPPSRQSVGQSRSQTSRTQRLQYAWDKALEGMAMGGTIAGPYGAGGGLLIGLVAGLFTADSHYAQLDNQIQSEQAKDQELETKVKQELERQKELDAQLEAQLGNTSANPGQVKPAELPPPVQKPTAGKTTMVALSGSSTSAPPLPKEDLAGAPSSPFKNVEIRDINGDGVPDLWIYHNTANPAEVVRQEEASHWDGRVDTWSYFKNGKLVRREVDTNGNGTADTVYYYDNDKIVKEERYEKNGSGGASFRAIYENGRRAKVEKDTTGRGRTDLWIYYDATRDGDIVLREERDLNGDGAVDQWSYYENGRLVRRDLSAPGLEAVSKLDEVPSPPSDPVKTFPPKVASTR